MSKSVKICPENRKIADSQLSNLRQNTRKRKLFNLELEKSISSLSYWVIEDLIKKQNEQKAPQI